MLKQLKYSKNLQGDLEFFIYSFTDFGIKFVESQILKSIVVLLLLLVGWLIVNPVYSAGVLEINVRFASSNYSLTINSELPFVEKIGGCQNNFVGDKKNKAQCIHFKMFSLLIMEIIGKSRIQLMITIKTEFAGLKIRFFP